MTAGLRRARSEEQKQARRQQILQAAEHYVTEVGYEAFSMAKLAQYSGVVKGTLYLYFNTREEVFLTLYNRSLQRWGERFTQCLVQGMSDYDYVKLLYQTASADELFIPLLVRLEHVIEHNVAMDSLVASKRQFINQINNIANQSAPILGLNLHQAVEVVKTMGVLLVGAIRVDQGPTWRWRQENLPADVRALLDSFSSERLFIKNACRIIKGIRTND